MYSISCNLTLTFFFGGGRKNNRLAEVALTPSKRCLKETLNILITITRTSYNIYISFYKFKANVLVIIDVKVSLIENELISHFSFTSDWRIKLKLCFLFEYEFGLISYFY